VRQRGARLTAPGFRQLALGGQAEWALELKPKKAVPFDKLQNLIMEVYEETHVLPWIYG